MEEKKNSKDQQAAEAFNSIAKNLDECRRIPVSTYRLQLNHLFKFIDAKSIVSYLHDLGITDCYTSPYFKAKRGSLHGYDILDQNSLNPEIGTEEEYKELIEELGKYGMGHILDIVPNHMSIASDENRWWMDVLENGPSSPYADFFDIDWNPVKGELENKVLLPILGDQYGNVLENQELSLSFDEGAFYINYYDRKLPVAPVSYLKVLKFRIDELEKKMGEDNPNLQELLSITTALTHLPPRTERSEEKIIERRREKEVIKRRLWVLYTKSEEVQSFLDDNVRIFNGEKDVPRSFDLLDYLLNEQAYRLSHWRVATEEINYRRFFDINELAAIRMENPHVFNETHQLIFHLVRERKVTGLRVDHLDGLYNPPEYFYRLQKGCFAQFCLRDFSLSSDVSASPSPSLQRPFYIVGEKILTGGERLPEDWPIFGTTGYGFLNSLNGIFIDAGKAKLFDAIYSRFIKLKQAYQDLVYEKKKLIMQVSMSGEVNTLGHYLNRLSEKNRHTRDFTLNSLTRAIVEVVASFPVYRTYVTCFGVNDRDRRYIEVAVSRAKRKNPAMSITVFDFLKNVLLLQFSENLEEADKMDWLDFTMRFQQVTGPVMAKGMEDTAFYIYNRLISLNEVGGSPERLGTSLDTFHGQNMDRTKLWPCTMITTTTHDTKRSEDIRARVNVLSEIPNEWKDNLLKWSRINKKKKTEIDGQEVPNPNEEYLLYQTLIGAWPIDPMNEGENETFKKRMKDYMIKATREAKVNTSWISPNSLYEEGLSKFIDAILSPSPNNLFLVEFEALQKKVSYFGMYNSLSQTLLKITSPGVPDFYQSTELWNFSLVDPDNRRPVDYSIRKAMLRELKEKIASSGSDLPGFHRDLLRSWQDGSIKLYVTYKALNYRRENHRLFLNGIYIPLASEGRLKDHVCAFARQGEGKVLISVAPRFLTQLAKTSLLSRLLSQFVKPPTPDEFPLGEQAWSDSWIVIPNEITEGKFCNVFTTEILEVSKKGEGKVLALGEIFNNFPVAMLEGVRGEK